MNHYSRLSLKTKYYLYRILLDPDLTKYYEIAKTTYRFLRLILECFQ